MNKPTREPAQHSVRHANFSLIKVISPFPLKSVLLPFKAQSSQKPLSPLQGRVCSYRCPQSTFCPRHSARCLVMFALVPGPSEPQAEDRPGQWMAEALLRTDRVFWAHSVVRQTCIEHLRCVRRCE